MDGKNRRAMDHLNWSRFLASCFRKYVLHYSVHFDVLVDKKVTKSENCCSASEACLAQQCATMSLLTSNIRLPFFFNEL